MADMDTLTERLKNIADDVKDIQLTLKNYIETHQRKHDDEMKAYYLTEQSHTSMHGDVCQKIAKLETDLKVKSGLIATILGIFSSIVVTIIATILKVGK